MKKRCITVSLLFFMLFFLLDIRMFHIQYNNGEKYSVMADSQYQFKEKKEELNYRLVDDSGKDLLDYNSKYSVVVLPSIFAKNNLDTNYEEFLKFLYILKNYDESYDLSNGNYNNNNSQKLYFQVDKNTYDKLKNIKGVKGFYLYKYDEVERKDVWKIENVLTNIRNTQDSSLKEKDSLEMIINEKFKDSKNSSYIYNTDLDGNITEEKNRNANSIDKTISTLNSDFQDDLRNLLKEKYSEYEQIGVVISEPSTGKIRSLVQKDETLPNVLIGAETLNGFFPGSIFKTLVYEGAITKYPDIESKSFHCTGVYEKKSDKHHGKLNINEAFAVSCNDIFSQIGVNVGFDKLNELCNEQHLFQKVLGLSKEQKGNIEVKTPKAEDGTLGIMSIGQNLRITPLEALNIINTIVNKGKYIPPVIVDEFVKDNETISYIPSLKSKQILTEKQASIIETSLRDVVLNGTAKAANIEGAEVGGKTGSTERYEVVKNDKGESTTKKFSDGWFIGFLKKENISYTVVIFVKNINKDTQGGGTTAAPIFKDIAEYLINKNQ
ncbi:penicillin-binding transpeptidase domain-containing protein [Clostridium peptidivorans]|uniref:penicillin-binding transpeptidase domain-containing protein n=1 Tax=Clostridium peptidivorans TaxID=100174 RepID=UPI000BE2B060|nr:penicillin-binding transpeptidase domain-containing protein [Clostridium peptidivorans]